AHGDGVSDDSGAIMPSSNLEADEFTQLSELWIDQCASRFVRARIGKQDASRDFAGPRFAGNFVNSSFGAVPTVPMPTFPAPALGANLTLSPVSWFQVNGAAYDGAPALESFGHLPFAAPGGTMLMGSVVLQHELAGRPSGIHTLGAWHHTGERR